MLTRMATLSAVRISWPLIVSSCSHTSTSKHSTREDVSVNSSWAGFHNGPHRSRNTALGWFLPACMFCNNRTQEIRRPYLTRPQILRTSNLPGQPRQPVWECVSYCLSLLLIRSMPVIGILLRQISIDSSISMIKEVCQRFVCIFRFRSIRVIPTTARELRNSSKFWLWWLSVSDFCRDR